MAGPRRKRKGCSGRCSAGTGKRQCRKVFLFKDDAVMECMPGDDESHSEDGDFLAAGGAAAEPGRVIEGADQSDVGAANGGEFLEQLGKFAGRGVRNFYIVVLFESWERRLIAAGDAKQAVGEDPFSVVDVTKTLLYGPFARGVTENGFLVRQPLP